MAGIDDRVVSISFDNAKFEAGVAKTLATLQKLDAALKKIGTENGLGNLEKAANKLDLSGATSALDKLNAKIAGVGAENTSFSKVEADANKITFGPFTSAIENVKSRLASIGDAPGRAIDALKTKLGFQGADAGLNNIEAASRKVTLEGPGKAADTLRQKLAFPGVEQNFANIESASNKVRLSGITNAINEVSKGFSVLQGAAAVALGSIMAKAAAAGASLVKDVSFGPITQGFQEYATNLNSIQTILANTKFEGANLRDVNRALAELNKYSDQTIYNFSEMAKNIGTFTAAGVNLKDSTASIKGIANLAALSGSNSQQASTAMYQLSQAIASGRVSLQDWNSVVNAGMGGATFQRALATTASTMGTIADGALKIDEATGKATINGESFRESITAKPGEESWLTSDVLTKTLQQFTGDLSDAELAAQGFNAAQIKAIQETAKTAKLAATEVKTIKQAFDVVKESIGSGWAKTFQLLFGDFEEAKSTFTSLTTAITGFVGTNADARNKVLEDWKELGGRTHLIEGIKRAFEALMSVLNPIKEAFRDIFPKKTGQDLYDLTLRFENFMERLKIGPETAEGLRRTFAGFFAVLSIGKQIITGIVGVFGDLLGALSGGNGGFLSLTGTVGDWLVSIDKALKKGDKLKNFFDGLGQVLSAPIGLLSDLAGALGDVFGSGGASDKVSSGADKMGNALRPLESVLTALEGAWAGFLKMLGTVGEKVGPIVEDIANVISDFAKDVGDAIENMDFNTLFEGLQTGLMAGILLSLKKALSGDINIDLGGGVLKNLSDSFTVLTGSLKTMQRSVQAGTLLKIAAAIALLAAGITALSLVDPKRLTGAMTAIGVGMGQLVGGMALLMKIGGWTAFLQMPIIAASLILLAGAITVLSAAVKIMSTMSWEELTKGLVGVGGALTALAFGVALIPKSIMLVGPALLPIAVALNIMAVAMKIFATMSWEEMAKGLIGVAGGLTALGLGVKLIGPSILLIGPGLIAVAVGLNILALAVKSFGGMDLKTLYVGIAGIGASLFVLSIAIGMFPPTLALQAAGLLILAGALTVMAGAIGLMGSMSMGTIAKGLTALGLALVILSYGLRGMMGTIPGAVALLAAAAALAILTPVLATLGNMKWTTIVKGLLAMAAILTILAAAGTLAAAPITALGVALAALAASALLVGAGVYLLASGLAKLGGEGSKGITAAMVALTAFIAILPKMIIDFLKGLVEVLAAIASLAPKIVASLVKILEMLLEVIIQSTPKMAEAAIIFIGEFLRVLVAAAPQFVEAGARLLLAVLTGIDNHIVEIVTRGISIVVKFLETIAANLPQLITAGVNFLVAFLSGIAGQIPRLIGAGAEALAQFLIGIARNMDKVIDSAVKVITEFLGALARNMSKLITAGATLVINFLNGIADNIPRVVRAAGNLAISFFNAVVKELLHMADAGARAVIEFINGVADAIRKHAPALGRAGANLGTAIIQGVITGMWGMAQQLVNEAWNIISRLPSAVAKFLGISSPSKVFMEIGKNVIQGMVVGINNEGPAVNRTARSTASGLVSTIRDSLSEIPDIMDGLMDMDPVITPVLDLSNVKAGAKKLGAMTNVVPITAAASYSSAASISSDREAAHVTQDESTPIPPSEIRFEQNNYSPESLSTLEIYRRTKNQLALAKDTVGVVTAP